MLWHFIHNTIVSPVSINITPVTFWSHGIHNCFGKRLPVSKVRSSREVVIMFKTEILGHIIKNQPVNFLSQSYLVTCCELFSWYQWRCFPWMRANPAPAPKWGLVRNISGSRSPDLESCADSIPGVNFNSVGSSYCSHEFETATLYPPWWLTFCFIHVSSVCIQLEALSDTPPPHTHTHTRPPC